MDEVGPCQGKGGSGRTACAEDDDVVRRLSRHGCSVLGDEGDGKSGEETSLL